jgi:hypothetical protein
MEKETHQTTSQTESHAWHSLKFLNFLQIQMIDEALSAVGEYGEVRLIMQKGRLRFVVTQNSHDALLWEPGSLKKKVPGSK